MNPPAHRRSRHAHGVAGRRRWRLALLVAGVVVVVGALILLLGVRDARRARNDLESARSVLSGVSDRPESLSSADGRATAEATLRSAVASVANARSTLNGSLAFRVARFVRVLSTQRRGLFRLVDDAQIAVSDGNALLAKVSASADALHIRQGSLPLDVVSGLGVTSHQYGVELAGLIRPTTGLWGQLRSARAQFNTLDDRISKRLVTGGDGLQAATTFLGSGGPRHYFLGLQNNAEMRDQGMVLSYGTITATAGHLSVDHTGRIAELTLQAPAPTPVPQGTATVFAEIGPTKLWQSVDATPDFAFSGRAMVDMYHQATGESVSGVIALDVPALAQILDVIGPVNAAGVATPISSANAATVLLHDLYSADNSVDQGQRIEHLSDVAGAIVQRMTHGDVDSISLARHLATAAAGGHIKLYSSDPTEEATFEHSGLGGGPALVMPDRTFHIDVQSRLAAKVDYYIHPSITQQVSLRPDGSAGVHTTIVVDNTAPVGAGPSEQLGPDLQNGTAIGDYVAWCLLWAPAGAQQADAVAESGLQVTQKVPLVHAGQKISVTFDTIIPHAVRDGKLELRYVPQPRLTPDDLTVILSGAGWRITGPAAYHASMDRTLTPTWNVQHR